MNAEDEIWKAVVAANKAWVGGRPGDVAALFDENVVLQFPDSGRRVHGREAMVRDYAEFCQRVETTSFKELEHAVDVMGDTAVVTYLFALQGEVNGNAIDETGREFLVFKRSGAGWRVIWRARTPSPDRAPIPKGGAVA